METGLQLYKKFRESIDTLCFPLLIRTSDFREILYDGKVVGFLMVMRGYVDGIYVEPEYRGKGLARKAVLDYLSTGGIIRTLHIVNSNTIAKRFWESLFTMRVLDSCDIDTLYQITGRSR